MLGINKGPIVLAGLRSDFFEGRANVTNPIALGKLVDARECVALVIQNRLNNLDGSGNACELLVGTGSGCQWQLIPGQESPLIYVTNLNDVWVRQRVAITGAATGVGSIETIVLNAGGAGYSIGDILTLAGGINGTVRVTNVAVGVITAFVLVSAGSGYTVENAVATTSPDGGAGATFNITALTINDCVFPFLLYSIDPNYSRIR